MLTQYDGRALVSNVYIVTITSLRDTNNTGSALHMHMAEYGCMHGGSRSQLHHRYCGIYM